MSKKQRNFNVIKTFTIIGIIIGIFLGIVMYSVENKISYLFGGIIICVLLGMFLGNISTRGFEVKGEIGFKRENKNEKKKRK
jgi:uncharacterized membrane protein AbrB (regulator of aidB expression)